MFKRLGLVSNKSSPPKEGKSLSKTSSNNTAKCTDPAERSVKFDVDNVVKHDTPPLYQDEIEAYFYQDNELAQMNKDRDICMMMYKKCKVYGVEWDENADTIRGVEAMMKDESVKDADEKRRNEHIQRIIAEAKKQANSKNRDEAVRKASRKASKDSEKVALALAKDDAKILKELKEK